MDDRLSLERHNGFACWIREGGVYGKPGLYVGFVPGCPHICSLNVTTCCICARRAVQCHICAYEH